MHQHDVLLTVEDLHTWFELRRFGFFRVGYVRAVDGVSFQVGRGEAVAVVGESGCGKSTLARTILGLHAPTKGRIVFAGQPLDPKDEAAMRAYRAQVGYVQQDPFGALPPFMDVRRILTEPLVIHGIKDRARREVRIREALEDVRLTPVEDFLDKFPHQLSGGQQQRLVIARALILRPKLIVADEPVSMLDASVRVEILQLLRRLQETYGISILYITHDLSTVRFFSERILVMYGAKIVEQARTQDLLSRPQHPYTRALLNAIPDPDPDNARRFREVPGGEPPSLLHPPPGCRFHLRCPAVIRGVCDGAAPPDLELAPAHKVACWLYADHVRQDSA
ncbi:MAG: ABC transporter ATP-binding protein [Limnochordales bacterium]|nr:ABC transporter ATP-binding protein [Limnochordales bacterium]